MDRRGPDLRTDWRWSTAGGGPGLLRARSVRVGADFAHHGQAAILSLLETQEIAGVDRLLSEDRPDGEILALAGLGEITLLIKSDHRVAGGVRILPPPLSRLAAFGGEKQRDDQEQVHPLHERTSWLRHALFSLHPDRVPARDDDRRLS